MLKLWDSFFSKCSKFNEYSKNAMKMQKNIFNFFDNCIWIGSGKFSLLRQKRSSSAVNLLNQAKLENTQKENEGGKKLPRTNDTREEWNWYLKH